MFPNVIKVNQSLTLSCSADVGAPNGSINIWKLSRNSNVTELIFTSNTSEYNAENCTKFVNVTFNYTVAREEDVALFRCSSQNVLNKGAGPSLDLQISEKCKTLVLMSSNINYSHNQHGKNIHVWVWSAINVTGMRIRRKNLPYCRFSEGGLQMGRKIL